MTTTGQPVIGDSAWTTVLEWIVYQKKVVQTTYEYDQYGNIITIRTNDALVGSFEYAYDQIRNGTGRAAPTCRFIPRAYTESRSFPSALEVYFFFELAGVSVVSEANCLRDTQAGRQTKEEALTQSVVNNVKCRNEKLHESPASNHSAPSRPHARNRPSRIASLGG
jgi:hypothetical protein